MFFPLHDQNNEAVKTVPIISYLVIGLCLLVQLYSIILGIGPSGRARSIHFIYRHGMVPATYFNGETTYQIGPENIHMPPEAIEKMRSASPGSDDQLLAELLEVKSASLWIWLMPLTCTFLHAGWMHLLMNVWFFWIFSDNVEERFGTFTFLIFYLFVAVFSSLAHALIQSGSTIPMVGASGAISGVMGAYLVLFPRNHITSYFCPIWFFIRRIDVPAIVVLGFYLLLNMLQMYQSDRIGANVAFDAHIFGFIGGLLFASLLKKAGRG